jgi:outer membrane immunogenic protein
MKKLLLAGAAMLALFGGTATAADLRAPPPVYRAPPPVYVYSWTGCYVGGNVGGVWIRKDETLVTRFGTIAPAGTAFGSHDADSFLGGVQAGCNYQVGGWVFGIQGDYDWMNASGSHVNSFFSGVGHPLWTDQSKSKSLASVTGRIGYAWDRLLGYVKGGGAWERDDYTITFPSGIASTSETRSGWTVGVGLEYAFTNWLTGFVEYDYYGFGTRTNAFVSPTGTPFSVDIKETKNVVKVGLNWKFGPAVGPY